MLTLLAAVILTSGKIWTGDARQPWAEAVKIEGNRIVAVGKSREIGRNGSIIDVKGRLVVPGFIDDHTHFIEGGFELSRVQLRDAATPQEFARRIGEYARRAGSGKWIVGGEWDHTIWNPPALPTRQLIDALTPQNPVFVSRLDGHMGLANSLALKMANVTRDTPDPAGGTIVRDANGEPTGILKDAAQSFVDAVIPSAPTDERVAAAKAALAEAARLGVTAFVDMSSGEAYEDFRAYQRLEKSGDLTARVYLFTPILEYKRLVAASVEKAFGGDRLRIGGLKGFADGSLGSSTAAMFEPFSDDPKNRGLTMAAMTDGRMKGAVSDADAHNLQVAIHAIGDRANDEVLEIYESIGNERERRFRIEHAQHLSPDLIKRFAADRVIASMQPYHAIDDGRWAEAKIGHERARWTYAFRTLIDAGATLTFGSDWTVAPLNPILGVYAAVTRRTLDGKNPNGWIPEQKITVEEALRCYTVNNAYAMFRENEIGKIAPGMFADMAILSDDLFTIAPEKIEKVRVDITIFDGRVIYERGASQGAAIRK
ncbi:MAG TPA: amidohydrolase [Thermoanaerobaculia bacterium]|nr:amidohydrolase [Thermoanaerobaculia bacterium]